jgi:hypothetical protein
MIWLFIILILLIYILEFIDEILTQLDLKKYGIQQESNKLIKKLEETHGEKGVFIYKLISTTIFAIISWYIYQIDNLYFYILAGIIIFLYLTVDIHNFTLLKKN